VSRLQRRPPPSRPVIDFYASGLLHTEKDFYGATIVGAKPGIIAASKVSGKLRYETKVPRWIEAHLRTGGQLFCDSGAFGVAFTDKALEFNSVFRFYLQLMNLCRSPSQLILVMPDCVGEQTRTIRLWEKYHDGIAWWLRRSCTCLFPLQGFEFAEKRPGALTLIDMYRLACGLFNRDGLPAALPMKKAATRFEDALAFVAAVKPPHMHLLGLGRKVEAVQLAVDMVRASPATVVTADAVESTTAYGGRHGWVTPAARARVVQRQEEKRSRGSERGLEMWHRGRMSSEDDEIDWWLPTPDMGPGWQDRFEDMVQELVAEGLARREISKRQAELALRSPAAARRLFRAKFRAADAVLAMAHHMAYRMAQTPVPQVNEVR